MNLYACVIEASYGGALAIVAANSAAEVWAELDRLKQASWDGDYDVELFRDPEGNEVHISSTFLKGDFKSVVWIGQAKPEQKPGLVAFGGHAE